MRNTRWIQKEQNNIKDIKNIDKDIIKLLPKEVKTKEEVSKFLNSSVYDISDPFLMQDMDKAVDRILKARDNNENIWIYGDYDVDGITSTSLAYLALKEAGINSSYYIPLRDEGYGLNCEAIKQIADEGGNLIITVDCGISSHKEIEYATELGIDVIITDHHEINAGVPEALAAINPKRDENIYEFKYLAGVGTIFMVMYALYKKLGYPEDIFKYLDIVALGTVADIVPLLEENRIFTKVGMEKLNTSKHLGLRMLIKTIYEDYADRKFSPYDIGFVIAPIFNAAGRLEDAKMAVRLLVETDHVECTKIIGELLKNNKERKEIQKDIHDKTIDIIEKEKLYEKPCIIVAEKNFHHGVIGIVASKIVDKYYKPTIIMTIKEDEGIATASCRSIEGFNIVEMLNYAKDSLLKYGGHAGAAGFSLEIDKITEFSEKCYKYAKENSNETMLTKPIKISSTLPGYKLSYDFLNRISALEPFGFGNPSPLFLLKDCDIDNVRAIGKDKNHTMFNAKIDDIEIRNCVWWNSEDIINELKDINKADIVCKLKLETYRDRYQYKIFAEDIQESHEDNKNIRDFSLYDTVFPIETVFYTRHNIKKDSKLSLEYTELSIDIINDRRYTGELDKQTDYILRNLRKNYGYDFDVKIKDIDKTNSNYTINILIDKKMDFKTYSIKPAAIFRDIKIFLIGNEKYNSMQSKVLASIFKNRKKTVVKTFKNRGITTLIKTISLFMKATDKKLLVVGDDSLTQNFKSFTNTSSEILDDYDFYIEIKKDEDNISLYFAPNLKNREFIETIIDDPQLPKNVILMEEDEILNKDSILSRKLPRKERLRVLENLKNYSTLYATEDIYLYI